ncbi:variable surface protein [Plasmodium gonderi]|uniref:Variable surface protein n=1 Tax=Plasmodium gonderi TaxID=77519 RepID=A0A1Y1JNX2_PLAGO|nr:variable surface protein [Plasmodium gonderi]GAW83960.1 variable surface protein [Plasmodium gonderi]
MGNDFMDCPESYKRKKICYSYFHEKFNTYPRAVNIEHEEYLNYIYKFPDPILKYVALYFYNNYSIAEKFFNKKDQKRHNVACAVMNRWLNQQKSFYTHFGKCHDNTRWWDIYIEPLWEKLEEYYSERVCKRFNSYYDKPAAGVISDKNECYKREPEEFICYDESNYDNSTLKTNCAKLSILFSLCKDNSLLKDSTHNSTKPDYCPNDYKYEKINYTSLLKTEKYCDCPTLMSNIFFPVCVTILGTLFLAFFLLNFTPLGRIFSNRVINKNNLIKSFNEELVYEQHERSRNNIPHSRKRYNIY